MNPIQKYLAPMLSRLIGVAVAGISTWIFDRFGILIDAGTQQEVVTLTVFMIIYVITNRLVARKTNPSDTAKPPADAVPTSNPMVVPQSPTDSAPTT